MNNSVFRKKSLEKVNSPDDLNNAIRVTQPAVWMVLVALVLVFVGFFVWAVFGTLDSTVDTVVVSRNGESGCYVSETHCMEVAEGMQVIVGSQICEVGSIVPEKCCYADYVDDYVSHYGKFADGEYLYYYRVLGEVPEGTYKGKIIIESINAIQFLWN